MDDVKRPNLDSLLYEIIDAIFSHLSTCGSELISLRRTCRQLFHATHGEFVKRYRKKLNSACFRLIPWHMATLLTLVETPYLRNQIIDLEFEDPKIIELSTPKGEAPAIVFKYLAKIFELLKDSRSIKWIKVRKACEVTVGLMAVAADDLTPLSSTYVDETGPWHGIDFTYNRNWKVPNASDWQKLWILHQPRIEEVIHWHSCMDHHDQTVCLNLQAEFAYRQAAQRREKSNMLWDKPEDEITLSEYPHPNLVLFERKLHILQPRTSNLRLINLHSVEISRGSLSKLLEVHVDIETLCFVNVKLTGGSWRRVYHQLRGLANLRTVFLKQLYQTRREKGSRLRSQYEVLGDKQPPLKVCGSDISKFFRLSYEHFSLRDAEEQYYEVELFLVPGISTENIS